MHENGAWWLNLTTTSVAQTEGSAEAARKATAPQPVHMLREAAREEHSHKLYNAAGEKEESAVPTHIEAEDAEEEDYIIVATTCRCFS